VRPPLRDDGCRWEGLPPQTVPLQQIRLPAGTGPGTSIESTANAYHGDRWTDADEHHATGMPRQSARTARTLSNRWEVRLQLGLTSVTCLRPSEPFATTTVRLPIQYARAPHPLPRAGEG
jgi:hypothetical protein